MAVFDKGQDDSGTADTGREQKNAKPTAVYIEIKEFPRKKTLSGSQEEECGWLFVQKSKNFPGNRVSAEARR